MEEKGNEELDLRYSQRKEEVEKEIEKIKNQIEENRKAIKKISLAVSNNDAERIKLGLQKKRILDKDDRTDVSDKDDQIENLQEGNKYLRTAKEELLYWDRYYKELLVNKEVELQLIELSLTEEGRETRNAILKSKGVYDIFLKKEKARTTEESRELFKAYREVIKEISEVKTKEIDKGNKDKSKGIMAISEIIQILYIDSQIKKEEGKKQRKESQTPAEISAVVENANKQPISVKTGVAKKQDKKDAQPAPVDLEGAKKEAQENIDKVYIYYDADAFYFIRKDIYEKVFKRYSNSFHILDGVEEPLRMLKLIEKDELFKMAKDGELPFEIEVIDTEKKGKFDAGIRLKTADEHKRQKPKIEPEKPINFDEFAEFIKQFKQTVDQKREKFSSTSNGVSSSNTFSRNYLRDKAREYTVHLSNSAGKLVGKLPPSLQHLVGDPIKAMAKFDFWQDLKTRINLEKIHNYINNLAIDKLDKLLDEKNKSSFTSNKIVRSMLKYSRDKLNQIGDMLLDMMDNNANSEEDIKGTIKR